MNVKRALISNEIVSMFALASESNISALADAQTHVSDYARVTVSDKTYDVSERCAEAVFKHAVDYSAVKTIALRAYNAKHIASESERTELTEAYKHMIRTAKVLFKLAIVIECENNNK